MNICANYKDVLVPLKLQFFEEVAKSLNSFLVVFQTDKPMAPFLEETLGSFLRSFYAKFVRKEVLLEAITTSQLLKIDINAQTNLKSGNNVGVGFGLKFELQQLKSRGKITDSQITRFKTRCMQVSCGDVII